MNSALSGMMLEEITDFLASSPTAEQLYFYKPSATTEQEYQRLAEASYKKELSSRDDMEMTEYLKLSGFMHIIRQKALRHMDAATLGKVFAASWDTIENYYRILSPEWDWLAKPMQGLYASLRQQGYDRTLWAGIDSETFTLKLTRSRAIPYEEIYPRLEIEILQSGGMRLVLYEPPDSVVEQIADQVALTPELKLLLDRLQAHPI